MYWFSIQCFLSGFFFFEIHAHFSVGLKVSSKLRYLSYYFWRQGAFCVLDYNGCFYSVNVHFLVHYLWSHLLCYGKEAVFTSFQTLIPCSLFFCNSKKAFCILVYSRLIGKQKHKTWHIYTWWHLLIYLTVISRQERKQIYQMIFIQLNVTWERIDIPV